MDPDQLHRVRSFNRTVTQRIGALNDHFLGRRRPLGESRLLYEIGHSGAEIRHLRAQLELDSFMSAGCCALWSDRGSCRLKPDQKMVGFAGSR